MGSRRAARLACSAVAGLALAAAGLAGAANTARAGAGVPLGPVRGGIISTIEGGAGGPGPATSIAISPCGVRSAGGWLYIGDGSTVRRVSTATGALATVAGDDAAGSENNSGIATSSALSGVCSTVLDGAGNLVFATGSQVRVVAARTGTFYGKKMTAGRIYTVAGAGSRDGGPDGDGGPAAKAALASAVDVAFDQAGNLLIADSGQQSSCNYTCSAPVGSLVRVVAAKTGTFYGQPMTAGDIYTVAGVQSFGPAGEGVPAVQAWLGPAIGSVRPDAAGNLVLAEGGENDTYGVLAPSVQVIAAVTGVFYGIKMTAGNIYTVAGDGQTVGDGGPATTASLGAAGSAVVDGAGNLVIGDGNQVRVVAARTGTFYGQQMTAGDIYGIAGTARAGYSGDGGPAVRAEVSSGTVGLDAAGNVLLADGSDRVRVVAARSGTFYGQKMTAGDIYTVAGNGTPFSGDGGPPLRAEFSDPSGVSVDGAGDIAFSAVVYGVNTQVDLLAARSGWLFGMRMTAGRVYRVAGEGNGGFRGDGGPARDAGFCISGAAPVAFDHSGNLVVADGCDYRVRVIAVRSGRFYGQKMTAGDVYTIAGGTRGSGFSGDGGSAIKASLVNPSGVAIDHHGNVLIADGGRRVRVIAATTGTFYGRKMTALRIYTVAGDGSGTFSGDGGLAVKAGMIPLTVGTDAAGDLVIADGSGRVRLVAVRTGTMYGQRMTAGHIYTIAGNGTYGILGGVTTDGHGNVIFTDWSGGVVWVLAVRTGTFYGQAMTGGHTYAVAGRGATLGDGGPASRALLSFPFAVAVSRTGSLLVSDGNDNRLREISP